MKGDEKEYVSVFFYVFFSSDVPSCRSMGGGGGFGMTSTVCPVASSPNCLPAQQPPSLGHSGSHAAGMGLARDNPHAHNHYMTRPSYESLYSHARASPTCPPMLYHHHHHQSPHAHEYNTPTPPNSQAGESPCQCQVIFRLINYDKVK